MFENTFKNIDNLLRLESGCSHELDYTEQTSWIIFLKYLDDLEREKATSAKLRGKRWKRLIDEQYSWSTWAAPKNADGEFDHNTALTGDNLIKFVNNKLFPYLKKFEERATGPNTIEYKIGAIFSKIKNKFESGNRLRDVLEQADALHFRSQEEKHELSHLYEAKINKMGNAGRNGGEYYTPRPLIRAMIEVIKPKIGETIYDGACGSAGFLCEAYAHLRGKQNLTTEQLRTLNKKTFYGMEKKPLAYIIGMMNMILHGVEVPNLIRRNTLEINLDNIQDRDRHNIVLANPPFGGNERREVQTNFYVATSETAFLFLQHFMKILRAGGRAAIVIKNTFLSNSDIAATTLRRELLNSCNLHTVLDCPGGVFPGAGVKTVVLFFTKGKPTRKVWFYQLTLDRRPGKTNPLNDNDLAEFVALQKNRKDSPNSWTVNIKDIDPETFDLTLRNPNTPEEEPLRSVPEILADMEKLDKETANVLQSLKKLA